MANYPYRDLGIMLDLDNWQKLNDNFGDVATDLQLQKADYDAKLSTQQGEYNGKFGEVNARIDGIKQEISGEVLAEVIADASLIRQTPVDTFADLDTVYPTPETGWAAMTRDTGKVYRYNGTEWLEVEDIDPTAINEVDSRLTSQLAETRTELEARVSETIANAGDGTIPTELVDMRVSKEGTVFTVAGDYVRFLEDVMAIETTNLGETTTTVYDFFNAANDGGVSISSPYRKWGMKLVSMPFTANKIKIKVKTGNVTAGSKAVVEVRANLNGTLLATGSADLSTTQDYVEVTLNNNVALDNGVVITAWQELGGEVIVMPFMRSTTKDPNISTATDEGVYYNTTNNINDTVIAAGSTFKGLVFALQLVAQEVERVITNVKPQAVVKAKTLEVAKSGAAYSTIQAAVNDAVDGDTVLVHPGLYQEAVDAKSKEINIVGVSKINTILYNNTSDYYTPPLEIAAGMVKGLTIIEDHSNPDPAIANESVYAWERAYSIHIDYPFAQGKKLIIDDCILKNSKRHTLGIGTFQDNELVIQNCDIWTGTATRTGLDTAGVYFHNQTVEQNITNQKVRLINNVVYSDSKYALVIQDVTKPGFVSQLECEFINNMFYSKTDGKNCVKGGFTTNITLSPNSYGNNLAMLNA